MEKTVCHTEATFLLTPVMLRVSERGIYVVAFSYPVVPKGGARVRVQLSAAHTPADVARAVDAFAEVGKAIGLIKG